jgi:hypothetical protein
MGKSGGSVTEIKPSFWRRNRWIVWVAGAAAAVLAVTAVVVAVALRRAEPYLRARIVAGLEEHFHAHVELDTFHVSLAHGISAEGAGLRIWPPAKKAGAEAAAGAGEPLIRLASFRFHAPLHYKPGQPIHIRDVQLKGLSIDVPPRHSGENQPPAGSAGGAVEAPDATSNAAPTEAPPKAPVNPSGHAASGGGQDAASSGGAAGAQPAAGSRDAGFRAGPVSFVIDKIECTGTDLVLETDRPGKLPLEFLIAHLNLTSVTSSGAMSFEAELTNPRPVGTIHSTGSFGPWVVDDPGQSPVSGDYTFDHADLANFKGIAGILNSTGRYQGTLRNIQADGVTDTPDFRLTHFDSPLPLHTQFHAIIDGTDGDTWLEPVDAILGRSHFTAQGKVVRVPETVEGKLRERGRDVALKIDVDRARIEDFLRLASKPGPQMMTGDVKVKADLHIPPGTTPVVERMTLDGQFQLKQVQFTSAKIQDRIQELSYRGQGRPKDEKGADPNGVQSAMNGTFRMANGTIDLPVLNYSVPGAEIDLKGAYGLDGGTLNFAGYAKLQATVSQIVGGWKGLLLKPADRFFKKDGAGTEVAIHVKGTRDAPEFGIDLGAAKPGPEDKPVSEPQ